MGQCPHKSPLAAMAEEGGDRQFVEKQVAGLERGAGMREPAGVTLRPWPGHRADSIRAQVCKAGVGGLEGDRLQLAQLSGWDLRDPAEEVGVRAKEPGIQGCPGWLWPASWCTGLLAGH